MEQEKTIDIDPKNAVDHCETVDTEMASAGYIPEKRSYLASLRLFSGTYTKESLFILGIRPVVLLALPPVLWATFVMAGTIGFLVAISSNLAPAFAATYGFEPWQSGLCNIGSMIAAVIGLALGGWFSDWVADKQTRRNGGIREPEMRLPAIFISVITAPLGLILYGAGIQYKLHWICPTIGVSLCKSISSLFSAHNL